MAKAQRTLDLLNQLISMGFDDSAFWLLHHARLRNWRESILSHSEYCEKICSKSGEFEKDSENERVQRRLAWVLAKYAKSGKEIGDREYFRELADAAFVGLPPTKKPVRGKPTTARRLG